MMMDIPLSFLFKGMTSKDGSVGIYLLGLVFCFALAFSVEMFSFL